MEWRLFADLAERAGEDRVPVAAADGGEVRAVRATDATGTAGGVDDRTDADAVAGDEPGDGTAGDPPATVGEALDALVAVHPELRDRVFDDGGAVREHLTVLHEGRDVRAAEGLSTPVAVGDELALFPPVSGG